MSTTSRSPDGKTETPEEPEKKKPGSPGRYSLADEDEVPPTRIDSTTRMPAVRPELLASKMTSSAGSPAAPPPLPMGRRDAPPSSAAVSSRGAVAPPADAKDTKKKPITLPSKSAPQPSRATAPGMPATQRTPGVQDGKAAPSSRLPDILPPAKSSDSTAEPLPLELPEIASPSLRSGLVKDAKVESDAKGKDVKGATKTAAAAAKPLEPRHSSRPPRPPSAAPPASRRISSLRPPPPPKTPSAEPPAFTLEGFDEGSIAFAFDALVSDDRPSLPGTQEFDLAPVRELFAELAANHMRHVRDFMIDVKWGEVTRDWIHICVPPVRTLRRAAERLDLVELGNALEKVGDELDAANSVGGQMLDANEKQRLLDAYEELVKILPQAFALDRDKTQREAVIVQALLLQVPDVRKVTIDKLHAAGLTSLTVLFDANAHDIAHVAGIPHALASKIVDRVQSYRAELQSSSPQDARAAEREKLAGLNGQLKEHHTAYERAADAWGPEAKAKKRDHFRAREETWLEISVMLARFGEVDRLQGIEKVPFSQRIAQLSDYLEEARDKYRSPEG
jgi:hypothetical protein